MTRPYCMLFALLLGASVALQAASAFADSHVPPLPARAIDGTTEQSSVLEHVKSLIPDQLALVTDPTIEQDVLALRLVPLTRSELAAAASAWLAILRTKNQVVAEAQVELSQGDESISKVARERLQRLIFERNVLFDKYSAVVLAWEKKGAKPETIDEYITYRNSILIEETLNFDLETLIGRLAKWTVDRNGGVRILVNVGIVLLALLVLFVIARLLQSLLGRGMSRIPNMSELLTSFIRQAVFWLIIGVGLFVVLTLLGANVTPAVAVMGGVAFVLAFALQDSLGNLVAGLMIMMYRPFDVRDYVVVDGAEGTVRSVNIARTKLHTIDNKVVSVPNGKIWSGVITNNSGNYTRRVDMVFSISYSDDIDLAIRILTELVGENDKVLKSPEPVIEVNTLNSSSVDIICRPWVKRDDYFPLFWEMQRRVKISFDAAGITIPFPQQQVHFVPGPGRATTDEITK